MTRRACQGETRTECRQLSHVGPERAGPLPRSHSRAPRTEPGHTLESAFLVPWHQAASQNSQEVVLPLRWEALDHRGPSPT